MSVLKEARTAISDVLTGAGLTAFDHLPGRLTPPAAVVSAGSPYLTDGETYGHFLGRWDVMVIGATGPNEVTTDNLDDLIDDTIVAAVNAGYGVETVSQPFALDMNNAQYAAATVTIIKEIQL